MAKLTLNIDQSVIEASKAYVEKQGISLSSFVESLLKRTTGAIPVPTESKAFKSPTPITDELVKIIEKNQRTPEEIRAYEEDLYKRKPYMKELMEHYDRKHG